jgi:hypothetical protein
MEYPLRMMRLRYMRKNQGCYSVRTSPLPTQVRQTIRLKHYRSTEDAYLHYISDVIRYHDERHPRELGVDDVRAYLAYLAVNKQVAASTQTATLTDVLCYLFMMLYLIFVTTLH